MLLALKVEVRSNGSMGYQGIPIIGPGGVQFGIPVQASGLPVQASGIPVQASGIPVQASGIPVQASGIPVQAPGIPVQAPGVPVPAGGVTGVQSMHARPVKMPGLKRLFFEIYFSLSLA